MASMEIAVVPELLSWLGRDSKFSKHAAPIPGPGPGPGPEHRVRVAEPLMH